MSGVEEMSETIEDFVAKLQMEGVQAGQTKADEIIASAKSQAADIVAEAKKQAQKILSDAKTDAQSTVARSKTELNLAARDTVGRLRETLCDCINLIIAQAATQKLDDIDFIGDILKEIVDQYVKADIKGKTLIDINVSPQNREQLKAWAFKTLGQTVVEKFRPCIQIKDKLNQAGFEFSVETGTIEVTRDSVVDILSDMVTPELRKILAGSSGNPE